ncbi:unnamed protein product (macronuclear) [Paramecium tetraurelia]|uniref:Uncharacterized protein n=1 Tax=Paramecium tetraurelia TaxID=5888 RepID=A0BD72_PARTE|nr:uncharacterized protein GSPATT00004583001 [Paramecium tetraurelia]CAK56489.1 unnamed protein product [Paramecium tetraurelia]|eukprot:XP_001423887.1 hypothetical protein (macronuclear) [Paramecium tetraurelia strain d4-2]
MNKYRGKYDDSYKVIKTEGNQDIKSKITEQHVNRLTTRKVPSITSQLIKFPIQNQEKKAKSPILKEEKILDLLCLSTQQLKQVFKQPPTISTRKSIKVIRNTSLPKDFFTV